MLASVPMRYLGMIVLILSMAHPIAARAEGASDSIDSKSQLWLKNYKNLPIVIESLDPVSNALGLTDDAVRAKTEIHVRQAGLNPVVGVDASVEGYYLYVNILTVGPAFHVRLEFKRYTSWTLPNGKVIQRLTVTWQTSATGTHGLEGGYIIRALDARLDTFLSAYLKANR